MLRCLIVDDSPRFLAAARGLLERQGLTVVGVASTSAEALERVRELRPDAVVDLICFTPDAAQQLVEALRPTRPLLLHCGTIWVYGCNAAVPATKGVDAKHVWASSRSAQPLRNRGIEVTDVFRAGDELPRADPRWNTTAGPAPCRVSCPVA